MLYILDTDICSYIIRKRPPAVLAGMEAQVGAGHEICISSITYAELLLGAKRSSNPDKHLSLIAGFKERLHGVRPWDATAAECFSDLQTQLLNAGTPIGQNDAMIAAHAVSAGATVVTNNTRHFSMVSGLPVENWA